MHLYGTREKIFILNYARGFAPLSYQNQAKCYSTTLHKVNDTIWLELFPEIWHSSGTLQVLKGLGSSPNHTPGATRNFHEYLYTNDIYIPWFLWIQSEGLYEKPLKNQRSHGIGSKSCPDLGRAVQIHTQLQVTNDLLKAERKSKDFKLERKLESKLNFNHHDFIMYKVGNPFCVEFDENFKSSLIDNYLKISCIVLTH
jgi:hypothetical protein